MQNYKKITNTQNPLIINLQHIRHKTTPHAGAHHSTPRSGITTQHKKNTTRHKYSPFWSVLFGYFDFFCKICSVVIA